MTIYNVLINSNNRIAGGTTTSSATYYFDFGALPEGDYLLSWGFTSSNINTTINKLCLLSASLGQCSVYTASSTNIRATTTNILGTLIPNENDASSFVYGDSNTNNKIMLKRPNNNEFTVEIRALDGSLWTDAVANPIPEYLLALNFEKI
jgi:hypothetical protein